MIGLTGILSMLALFVGLGLTVMHGKILLDIPPEYVGSTARVWTGFGVGVLLMLQGARGLEGDNS